MSNFDLLDLLSTRFDTSKHGWKALASKALGISRPSLDRYLSLNMNGQTSHIPEAFLSSLLENTSSQNENELFESPYNMVNLLASGLCALQEGIDKVGHIQAPYPAALVRGLNIAAALNLENQKKYPTGLAELLTVACHPLYSWCLEYDGANAEEFGAAVLIKDGEITPDCLAIAGLSDVDPELHFYRSLMNSCSELDDATAQKFYVAWRRTVIEHPVANGFTTFLTDPILRSHLRLTQTLADVFYEPLPAIHTHENTIALCPISNIRLKKIHGKWVSESRNPQAAMALLQNGPQFRPFIPGMLELKRPARIFWALPGIQEVNLYKSALELGYQAELWPRMDAVDIVIKHPTKPVRFAVDIKEHRSSISLARSFDGFKFFRRHQQMIVIPDYLSDMNPEYLQQFIRARRAKLKTPIQILTASEFLHMLELNL